MPKLIAARTAQYPLVSEFTFNFGDTAIDSVGLTLKSFGSTFGENLVFDALPLPPGATVIGGEINVETAFVGPTAATVTVGDKVTANRYSAAVDLKATGRTALTLTGFRGDGDNVRLAFATTIANATAGKATVRLMYVVQNRSQESQIS